MVGTEQVSLIELGVTVAPNPTSGLLNINFQQPLKGTINLININGQELRTWTLESSMQLNLTNLPKGSYFLIFTDKDQKRTAVSKIQKIQ